MQKDELIQIHTFLFQIRNHLEQTCKNNGHEFQDYEALAITPFQVHRSKREHTLAVFKLSKGIAELLSHNDGARFEKLSIRLNQMAERFVTNKDKKNP
ncbi:MAG: UPF0058 family protein [Candidatus Thermoplasmatota archaeon]